MTYFVLREKFVRGTMLLTKFNDVSFCENWLISCDRDTHNLVICKNKRHIRNQCKKLSLFVYVLQKKKIFSKTPPWGTTGQNLEKKD